MINLENYVKDIVGKMSEDNEEIKNLNIMTIGKTGAGKSTLINKIFGRHIVETGVGQPITKHIEKVNIKGNPVTIYDTRGFEISSKDREEAVEEILNEIEDRANLKDSDERIHIIWYCINSGGQRIENYEIEFIEKMHKKAPVIIVLTQAIGNEAVEFAKYIKDLKIRYDGLLTVLAKDYEFRGMKVKSHGLDKLIDITYNMLDEGVRRSFINAQRVDLKKKGYYSIQQVKKAMKAAALVGAVPIPFSDAGVLVPIQTMMLGKITATYGFQNDEDLIKTVISGAVGMGGTTFVGRKIVTNAAKFIPGGNLVGGAISGSTAAIVTGALGYAYIGVLNYIFNENLKGKKVSNEIIISLMKKYFKESSKKGVKLLKDISIKEKEDDIE